MILIVLLGLSIVCWLVVAKISEPGAQRTYLLSILGLAIVAAAVALVFM